MGMFTKAMPLFMVMSLKPALITLDILKVSLCMPAYQERKKEDFHMQSYHIETYINVCRLLCSF